MKPKVRKIYPKVLALLAIPFILSGCARDVECNTGESHVHKYMGSNKRGTIVNYFDSEAEYIEDQYQDVNYDTFRYYRKDDYIEITKEDENFYKAKGKMFKGTDNWDFLYSIMVAKQDYLEYSSNEDIFEYWVKQKPAKRHFTGNVRVTHYQYCGHKLTYKDGKWVNERSPFVDDIRDIIDEYPYFEIDCYRQVQKEYYTNKDALDTITLEDFDEFTRPDLSNTSMSNAK